MDLTPAPFTDEISKMNSELAGIPGRWLKKTDVGGNPLAFGTKKYYEQNEGLNLVLTVDGVI